MNRSVVVLFGVLGVFLLCGAIGVTGHESHGHLDHIVKDIQWTGQASMKIKAHGLAVWFDPFKIQGDHPADVIFITHCHRDHLSPEDIVSCLKPDTVIVAPESCADQLKEFERKIITVKPGQSFTAAGIKGRAVPAYNVNKTQFHPKSNHWVGYVVEIDGLKIYHAGDTERIPEMKEITCDIALLPLGQTYTMDNVEDAVQAALDVRAKVTIPMHYGMYEGKDEDAETFKKRLEGKVRVVIKKR